jgi:hypothetical protein
VVRILLKPRDSVLCSDSTGNCLPTECESDSYARTRISATTRINIGERVQRHAGTTHPRGVGGANLLCSLRTLPLFSNSDRMFPGLVSGTCGPCTSEDSTPTLTLSDASELTESFDFLRGHLSRTSRTHTPHYHRDRLSWKLNWPN